jgi:hypothetical protein
MGGVPTVAFGYAEAERALGSLVAVRTALGDHASAVRRAARSTCVNWSGAYRTDFDHGLRGLDRQVVAAACQLATVARMISAAVDAANRAQLAYNREGSIPVGAAPS